MTRGRARAIIDRRRFLGVSSACFASFAASRRSHAQSNRDTTVLVVGFAAGGVTDGLARMLAEPLRESLAGPVIVENRVGAGGRIAVAAVVAAPPTGRMLLLTPGAMVTLHPHLFRDLPYDTLTQLVPVAMIASTDLAVVVGAGHPARDIHALLRGFREEPRTASCGSPGAGSVSHMAMLEITRTVGVGVTFVHYRSAMQQIEALLEGSLKATAVVPSAVAPYVTAGTVRALATTGAMRSTLLPMTPTLHESGIDVVAREWAGLFAPAGTPPETVTRLAAATSGALASLAPRGRFAGSGMEVGSVANGEFSAMVKADYARWAQVVKRYGVTGES
jgi:tripartite-type tricarboxylate transporter receptor subunit TctC